MRGRLPLAVALVAALGLAVLSPSPRIVAAPRSNLAAAASGSWTVYHGNDAHTGYDPTQPQANGATAGWATTLDGEMYAEPLVYNGIVYAATMNDTVYALNQATGAVVWSKHLRAPETSGWGCGGFSQQGIMGTPVIDIADGRIYVVTLDGTDDDYRLEGLNLVSGLEEIDTIITTGTSDTNGFNWTIQQDRGALAIANGYVYVPFGGRNGDCGSYHGYVYAVPVGGGAALPPYITTGTADGMWSAGGVVVDDATGKIFVATGNGTGGTGGGCAANVDGTPTYPNDEVIRLSATAAAEDFFVPPDWQNDWCVPDLDLGSASPVLLSSSLMFESGKWGTGFLLNPSALGGMDGQLFPTPKPQTYAEAPVCLGNNNDATFGSFAYAAPFIYVECNGHGIVALSTNTSTPSFSPCDATCAAPDWNAGGAATFGPPIVAGGAVWAIDTGGSGLYAFNAASGAPVFHSASFGANHFVTPAEAGGQVFVPSLNTIRSFNMTWTSLGGTAASGPDASSWGSSRVDVFVEGNDSALWQKTWNGSAWSTWSSLGGILTADPGAVSWGPNRIDVFARGRDGALWRRAWDGTTWLPWEGLGGQLIGGPDVASWGTNRLDVFVTGTDHRLWHRAWDGTKWWPWDSPGGYLTSSPSAVSWASGRIDIFGRGSDNQLWHNAWTGTAWYGWQPLGGLLASSPDAASCASGRLDVVVLGTDQVLWRKSWNGSQWSAWSRVDSSTWPSDPGAVCSPGTSSLNLVERSSNGTVWTTVVTGTT